MFGPGKGDPRGRSDDMHIIITGGTSHIGRRVASLALRQGHRVTLLGTDRADGGIARAVPWRLGAPVPAAAWAEPADALIHLAHLWHATGPEETDINLAGTQALLAAARRANISRLLFASSLSARADALNRYGRVKYRTEALLDGEGETAVRIGLVYGGPQQSLWGTLTRISALPVLPMIGLGQPVQPIHVDDVAAGLLRIATQEVPAPRRIVLAGAPIAFGDFLRTLGRARHGRQPLLIPLPLAPLQFVLDAAIALGLPLQGARERMLGLAGVKVQDGTPDAARLGLTLRPLAVALAAESGRRDRTAEAAAHLHYVLGRPASRPTLRRYLRGWRRYEFGAGVAPAPLRRCPSLMRLAEPLPWDRRPRAQAIRQRLHAAAVLAEVEPGAGPRFYTQKPASAAAATLKLAWLGAVEAALLLPRAVIGYWLWR